MFQILVHTQRNHQNYKKNSCCDVCAQEYLGSNDVTEELSILYDAINTIGQKGEVKLAQWIRGSSLSWTDAYYKILWLFHKIQ